MRLRPFREPVRLLFHLSGGYTKVLLERTEGCGMADGGVSWDIPTEVIPVPLRGLGARFLLVGQHVTPEGKDAIEELRAVPPFHVEAF